MSRKQNWTKVEIGPGVEEGHFFWVESDAEGVLYVQGTKPGCGVMVTRTTASLEPDGQSNRKISPGRVREAIEDLSDGEKADLYKSLCFAYQDKVRSLPEQSEGPCIRPGRLDRT